MFLVCCKKILHYYQKQKHVMERPPSANVLKSSAVFFISLPTVFQRSVVEPSETITSSSWNWFREYLRKIYCLLYSIVVSPVQPVVTGFTQAELWFSTKRKFVEISYSFLGSSEENFYFKLKFYKGIIFFCFFLLFNLFKFKIAVLLIKLRNNKKKLNKKNN